MQTAVRVALFCVALSQAVHAQPLAVGQPAPLTNTRYGARAGAPVLATNGSDFLLTWGRPEAIYVSPVSGPATPGRPILTTNGYAAAGIRHDVVWTGTRFLVAATRLGAGGTPAIFGRLLTAAGEPDGAEFPIANDGRDPRLAFNGTNVLMVYKAELPNRVLELLLGANGRPAAPAVWVSALETPNYEVASSGSNFLIAVTSGDTLHTIPVDASGAARAPVVFKSIGIADTSYRALGLIATDGGFYVVHRDFGYRVRAMKFDINGRFIAGGWTDRDVSRGPISVSRLGDGIAVASANYDQTNVRLLRVDRTGNVVPEVIGHPTGESLISVAAAAGKVLVAWTDGSGVIRVGDDGTIRSFGAADQTIELVTFSDDGVFVVWSEHLAGQKTYRLGRHTPFGDWKEIALPGDGQPIAAGAGGGQLLIVTMTTTGSLRRWSPDLEPLGTEVTTNVFMLPRSVAIAWTGNGFALIGPPWDGALVAMFLDQSGKLGEPKELFRETYTFQEPSIAFAAGILAVVWKGEGYGNCLGGGEYCPWLGRWSARAIRLRPDFSAIDAVPLELASFTKNVKNVGRVAWDGSAFVVAWSDATGLFRRRIPAAGPMDPAVRLADDASILDRNVVQLGSGLAYVRTATQTEPPYYGASRLLMTIGDIALPQLPDAPKLNGGLTADGTAILTWTAPPQETNGYRVEVRGANGAWTEIEQWLSAANARLLQIRVEGPASFRVRAWNDAGVSVYSNEVTPAFARRRSAR